MDTAWSIKEMKLKYCWSFVVLFLVPLNVLAKEYTSTNLYYEAKGGERARVIALSNNEIIRRGVLFGGISISEVESNSALARGGRTVIHPVYLYFGVKANYLLSPYIEGGIDLGDWVLERMDSIDAVEIDVYGSIGLSLNTDYFDVYLYYKKYNLTYDNGNGYINKYLSANFTLSGVGVAIRY